MTAPNAFPTFMRITSTPAHGINYTLTRRILWQPILTYNRLSRESITRCSTMTWVESFLCFLLFFCFSLRMWIKLNFDRFHFFAVFFNRKIEKFTFLADSAEKRFARTSWSTTWTPTQSHRCKHHQLSRTRQGSQFFQDFHSPRSTVKEVKCLHCCGIVYGFSR